MRRDTDVTLARSGAPSRPEGVGRQRTTTPHEVSAPSSVSKHTVPPRIRRAQARRDAARECRPPPAVTARLGSHRCPHPHRVAQVRQTGRRRQPHVPGPHYATGPADIAHLTSPVARTRRPRRRPPRCPPDRVQTRTVRVAAPAGPHTVCRCRSTRGPHVRGGVGPNSTTDRVPNAVARWAIPVSPQTTTGMRDHARRVRRAGTGPHAGPGHPIRRPGTRRRRVRLPPDPR